MLVEPRERVRFWDLLFVFDVDKLEALCRCPVNEVLEDLCVEADDHALLKEEVSPGLLLSDDIEVKLVDLVLAALLGSPEALIILDALVDDVGCPLSVQQLILEDQADDVAVANEELVLDHAERRGKGDHEADSFECITSVEGHPNGVDVLF